MDKNVLTSADIETLKSAVNKLKPGEVVTGSLVSRTINTKTGEPKIKKSVELDYPNDDHQIIDFSVAPILGEGIKGSAIIDAFKKAEANTSKKKPFSLKRTFFQIVSKIEEEINNQILNMGRVIYEYDEFGRVYFIAKDKKHYINKAKTQCITEDGYFANILLLDKEGNVELEYYPSNTAIYDENFINFDYMYISLAAAKEGKELINAEEKRKFYESLEEIPATTEELIEKYFNGPSETVAKPTKVVDFEAYRRKMEEEGPKR